MNTKIFINSIVGVALAATLCSCDENAWNDKLDGFKEAEDNTTTEQVESVEYTLTAADYKSIASNATNVAQAGDDLKAALTAVGTRGYFSDQIPAADYAPAFLASKFYYLDKGSSVKLTYRTQHGLPAELAEAAGAQLYTVSSDNYQQDVWESDEKYIDAFAPSKPASRFIPAILSENVDPGDGGYCVVTYSEAAQEPVFGGGDTPEPPAPWAPGSEIGDVAVGDNVDLKAVVTAICAQGYVVTDNSGSIFVYKGSSFDASSVAIGEQQNISGSIGAYNGGLQVTGSSATVEVIGKQAVSYPAPKVMTGADVDAACTRTGDHLAIYAQLTGKAVVTERNINIVVDGAETGQGSLYQGTADQKAAFTNDAQVTLTGYFIAIAGKRYLSFVATSINGKAIPAASANVRHKAAAVEVPTTAVNVLYHYENGRWNVASGFNTLSPADYKAMGQQYVNISAADAAKYLPVYLRNKYPYAQNGDTQNVMYLVYNSTDKTTNYFCDQYVYNGSAWTLNDGIVTETNQFVNLGDRWIYDPTVYITLPSGRGQTFSATYYQACVDWVYDNICVPMGDTSITSGLYWITKYGNNEYYSGTSAYQNNVDLRPGSAREQYAAGYEGMTDEQVVALMKKRFMEEVMPGALAKLHPDAKPMEGIDLIYQITFGVYTGESATYVARFKVTAPGTFVPVDCTWDD